MATQYLCPACAAAIDPAKVQQVWSCDGCGTSLQTAEGYNVSVLDRGSGQSTTQLLCEQCMTHIGAQDSGQADAPAPAPRAPAPAPDPYAGQVQRHGEPAEQPSVEAEAPQAAETAQEAPSAPVPAESESQAQPPEHHWWQRSASGGR